MWIYEAVSHTEVRIRVIIARKSWAGLCEAVEDMNWIMQISRTDTNWYRQIESAKLMTLQTMLSAILWKVDRDSSGILWGKHHFLRASRNKNQTA